MGKFKTDLKCNKYETIELCPICNSLKKAKDEWPQAGTHIMTIPYECGTEIDYALGHAGAQYGVTCSGEVKRFEMPDLNKMSNAKKQSKADYFKRKW